MSGDERAALEEMAMEYATHTTDGKVLLLTTSNMSALQAAFRALGWDDPHEVDGEESGCNYPGCSEWAVYTTIAPDGTWLRRCKYHGGEWLTREREKQHHPMICRDRNGTPIYEDDWMIEFTGMSAPTEGPWRVMDRTPVDSSVYRDYVLWACGRYHPRVEED